MKPERYSAGRFVWLRKTVWVWPIWIVPDALQCTPVCIHFNNIVERTPDGVYRERATTHVGSNRVPPRLKECGHAFATSSPNWYHESGRGKEIEVDSGVWEREDARNRLNYKPNIVQRGFYPDQW